PGCGNQPTNRWAKLVAVFLMENGSMRPPAEVSRSASTSPTSLRRFSSESPIQLNHAADVVQLGTGKRNTRADRQVRIAAEPDVHSDCGNQRIGHRELGAIGEAFLRDRKVSMQFGRRNDVVQPVILAAFRLI